MLNDLTSILSLLETRRSGKPREMVAPGPSPDELDRILTIAARTPDHGKLFPWRFVVVAADQREALADLLARALPESDPDALPAHFAKALEFAHQAPSLVVVVAAPVAEHKIPLWEQELSVGAAAMNLLLPTLNSAAKRAEGLELLTNLLERYNYGGSADFDRMRLARWRPLPPVICRPVIRR